MPSKAHRSASSIAMVGYLTGLAGCIVETDVETHEAAESEPEHEEPRPAMVTGEATYEDCRGEPLPSCDAGWTGPSCDHPCDPGERECGFRYYCHSDGRIAGLSLSRAHLFRFDSSLDPHALRDRLEQWIAAHEVEVDMRDGLTPTMLLLEPADDFEVQQGGLTLYRFRQYHAASAAHLRIPVVGEGALLTVQADAGGAVSLTGTLIDPRTRYAHASSPASDSLARRSISHHASLQTGIAEADVEVGALQLVAVPWAEEVAWYGVPSAGHVSIARVIVEADPVASSKLKLLMYDDGKSYALHDTTTITVRTQDTQVDPWMEPWVERVESTLTNGEPLLGSLYDGTMEPQLATEDVVVIDMHGNDFMGLFDNATMTWDFDRYTEANGQFSASAPDERFYAQRLYHLVKSGYSVVDRMALGKWDSALWLDDPTAQSAYPPGSYRPRVIVGNHYAPTGHAGQASWFSIDPVPQAFSGFPEAIQQPAAGVQNEIMATINTPSGTMDVEVLLHEVGHTLDIFLAPGYPDNHAPMACPGCVSCREDTSDEANPLTETLAQMFALWQLRRVFPGVPHDTCDLMVRLSAGTTNNQKNVHSPGCMDASDSIASFMRDDDPACPDASLCDKPSNDEADASMGSAHWCDATEGYHAFSILQTWWNMLHGLYCEPPGPAGVICHPLTMIWPPGCDQPGSSMECAAPDEVAGLAFLYAVRTNPTSYRQLVDAMVTFVACNYGPEAYDAFNQALCDHALTECGAPAPLTCQQCGNGIREGTEACDGQDLSVDEIGYIPSCPDFGYDGGILACQGILDVQPCKYDFSGCTMPGLDDTGTSTSSGAGEDLITTSGDEVTGPGGIQGGGNGCGCTSGLRGGKEANVLPLSVLLLLRGRRRGPRDRARSTWALALLLCAMLGMSIACRNQPVHVDSDEAADAPASSSSSGTGSDGASFSETGPVPAGWPEAWYGDYYDDVELNLGQEYQGLHLIPGGLGNLRLDAGAVTIERFDQNLGSEAIEWTFDVEQAGGALRVLPPDGKWKVLYPGAMEVLVRPGAGCEELVIEAHDLPNPYDPVAITPWHRGRICAVDPYDDSVCCDRWTVDLCPGADFDCGS